MQLSAAAQCVFTNVPCPPTPPACPAGGCGSTGNRGGGVPVGHDAYYYRIKAYNDLMDQAHAAGASGNFQFQLQLLLQAQQKDNTKYVRARIDWARGNIAVQNKDAVAALAAFEQGYKTCRSCFNKNTSEYLVKLKQFIAGQEADRNLRIQQQNEAATEAATEAANKAVATQRANSTVAASRATLERSVAAAEGGQQSERNAQIAAANSRTQAVLNGSAARQQAAQQKAAAGQLVGSNAFGVKTANPNDPDSPYRLTPGTQPVNSNKPADTNAFRSLGAVAGSSTAGATTSDTDPGKDIGSEDARKTIDTPGSASGSLAAPHVGTPHAEPVLTPEQSTQVNARLAKNTDYQKLLADHAQAANDVAKANQAVSALTAKYGSMPEGPAKNQVAVDVANALQASSNAQNVLTTNETKQQEIKQEEVDIVMIPPPAKKKPIEPPSPSLPPQ